MPRFQARRLSGAFDYMIKLFCKTCKKEFETYPSVLLQRHRKFCSVKCFHVSFKTNKRNHPAWKEREKIYCKYCNKKILVKPFVKRRNLKKFCDIKCYGKFLEGRLAPKSAFKKGHKPWNTGISGPQSHFWIHGELPYPPNWTKTFKQSIRERDNFTCQKCKTHQNKSKIKLHVHHIDYDKKNLNLNNLITLCKNCHAETNFNRSYWTKYFRKIMLKIS